MFDPDEFSDEVLVLVAVEDAASGIFFWFRFPEVLGHHFSVARPFGDRDPECH